jgi:hypothetical protein
MSDADVQRFRLEARLEHTPPGFPPVPLAYPIPDPEGDWVPWGAVSGLLQRPLVSESHAADALTRYRMEPGLEHHAMSGHGGDPCCTPKVDRKGEWVQWASVERLIQALEEARDEQGIGRDVDHTFARLTERQLTLAQKEAEMLRAERAVFETRTVRAERSMRRVEQQLAAARNSIEVLRRRIELQQRPQSVTDQQLEVQNRSHAEQVQHLLEELVLSRQNHAGSQAAAEREFARAERLQAALVDARHRLAAADLENARLVAVIQGPTL